MHICLLINELINLLFYLK
uniref:Uncharacterized protein n=1 Tax=Anguilla anguilla TaxID=7936 RepID=A0A0E9V7I2_ANGAN